MQKARGDFTPQVGRGQRGDKRPPETAETHVGRLITQRRLSTRSPRTSYLTCRRSWHGSWHGAEDSSSSASAISAIGRGIGAASAQNARGRTYGKKTLYAANTPVLDIKAAPPGSALGTPTRTPGRTVAARAEGCRSTRLIRLCRPATAHSGLIQASGSEHPVSGASMQRRHPGRCRARAKRSGAFPARVGGLPWI